MMRSSMATLMVLLVACEPQTTDSEFHDTHDPAAGSDDGADTPPVAMPGDLVGDVILRNRVALNMPVTLRRLADDVTLDCGLVEQDPTAHLPLASFAEGEVVTLSPHQMVVVWPHEPGARECYAVRVESEGLGARVLFWHDAEPPILPYHPTACCDVGEGVVELIPVDDGWSLGLLGNEWLVYDAAER